MSTSFPRRPRAGGGGGGSSGGSSSAASLTQTILLVSVGIASFFAGTLLTLHSGIDRCEESSFNSGRNNNPLLQQQQYSDSQAVEAMAQKRLLELSSNLPECKPSNSNNQNEKHASSTSSKLEFPSTTSKFAVGMARTSKLEFADVLDLGVPVDLPTKGDEEVLVVYSREEAMPDHYDSGNKGGGASSIPLLSMKDTVQHCDYLNVILTDRSKSRNQCIALVPQYESYHVQKWMRIEKDGNNYGKLDSTQPLHMVSRGYQSNGRDQFAPPLQKHIRQNWELLEKYFNGFDSSLADLKPLVEKVATPDRTVIVMVCNFGQSELLVNFVCAARSRNIDTSAILVFSTDVETKELAEHLGLTAFYDERNFGEMPSEAAGHYGDRKFTAMMMAKVICVQMVSALKYNLLFQDVDIVWYKNPLEYFQNKDSPIYDFDVYFQDDGGHTIRYAPYSANSGFYFVRYNARTEYFLTSLLLAGDLILKTDSHQQALIALMSEHVSLYGLRAKVLSRDTDEFPGGYHYHQASGKYMRALFAGEVDPYIFHMSWTLNKDNKLLFFQQFGEWYVKDECVHKKVEDIPGLLEEKDSSFISTCCSAEPLVSCHYRDKPSKIPCKDSPPIDKNKPSWW